LGGHPNIVCAGEVFKRKNPTNIRLSEYSFEGFKKRSLMKRNICFGRGVYDEYLSWFFQEKEPEIHAKGFKLMVNQLRRHRCLSKAIKRHDFFIIRLKRKNILKKYISAKIAEKNNFWVGKKKDKFKNEPIQLNTKKLLNDLKRIKREQDKIDTLLVGFQGFDIEYENFRSSKTSIMKDLQKKLGVDSLELSSNNKKINPDRIEDIIINYDEVYKILKDTSFSEHLV
jgi:hypothetical protein